MQSTFEWKHPDIQGPPPETEPERQYYFIEKTKPLVADLGQRLGHTPRVYNLVVGCQMNAKDSEKLLGILLQIGFEETPHEEEADLVVYNTCTVRENANQKVYGRLGYLNSLKREKPHMMIALCGCMMQEKNVVATIRKSYNFVDMVFGTHNIYKMAEILYRRMSSDRMIIDVEEGSTAIVEDLPSLRKFSFKAGVNIMFGCNNFCTFCIVPYVRGRERSRSPEDILAEIARIAEDGVTEVMLLGQNVNSYGKNLQSPMTFAALLKKVTEIPGIRRIRFMTSHPKDLSDELIEVMASSNKICRHIHLPLQSGSSQILRRMNRHYTKEQFLALARKIRERIPGISITTDIIVGFPGETEEDFADTMEVVEQIRFDSAYTFIYSKRTGTPAASMADQVPPAVVHARFDRLLKLLQDISSTACLALEGQVQEVLVENVNEQDPSMLTGRLGNNSTVHFKGDDSLIGSYQQVYLDEAKRFYYFGHIVEG